MTGGMRLAPSLPRTLLAVLAVEIGLRRSQLERTARLLGVPLQLEPASPHERAGAVPEAELARAARLAGAAVRRMPVPDSCLRRSLVAGHLLRRHHPSLRLGATDGPGPHRGHAWIELPSGQTLGARDGVRPFSRGTRSTRGTFDIPDSREPG